MALSSTGSTAESAPSRGALEIRGGVPLSGGVDVDGSKNAALPLLAAAACLPGKVEIGNVPSCGDVETLLGLLRELGWEVAISERMRQVSVGALQARQSQPALQDAASIRASYYLVPAMVGGYGQADLPWPGGCSVGDRGMDLHFGVYAAFGDHVETASSDYTVTAAT